MVEVEMMTCKEASEQYKEKERKRREALSIRDALLLDILTDLRYYCGLNESDVLREYENRLIEKLNTWRDMP
jgi:hypothetical protein